MEFVEPLLRTAAIGVPIKPGGWRQKFYRYTAIDGYARLRVLKIYPRRSPKTAIQLLDCLLSLQSFAVETIQTDNGAGFQPASTGTDRSCRPPTG
ncbi:hypothetical protein [Amycolatopsis sp. lyj-112]|uniref:hypothetical protein n=1 Tax=Amycolatopsis sp. lyj-112 TaxID=2789288 RepID=UPI003978AD2C